MSEIGVLQRRRHLRVYEYLSLSGQLSDEVWEDRLRIWGRPITEEEARQLIPDLDKRRALLDQELEERARCFTDLFRRACTDFMPAGIPPAREEPRPRDE